MIEISSISSEPPGRQALSRDYRHALIHLSTFIAGLLPGGAAGLRDMLEEAEILSTLDQRLESEMRPALEALRASGMPAEA
jgi:hypothetical protein